MKKKLRIILSIQAMVLLIATCCAFGQTGVPNGVSGTSKWVKHSGYWYYFNSDSEAVQGWIKLANYWYYMDENYHMVQGWQKIDGKWYYFFTGEDGRMASGWQQIGGEWYYLGTASDGAAKTGWQKISNKWYYFNSDCAMVEGWLQIDDKVYYLNEGGDGSMATGWKEFDEGWYYFGTANQGWAATEWAKVGSTWYFFDENHLMVEGWLQRGSSWFYLKEGGSGAMAVGACKVDDEWHGFDSDGFWVGEFTGSTNGELVANFAKLFSGYNYKYGGFELIKGGSSRGTDCSGFVSWIYKYGPVRKSWQRAGAQTIYQKCGGTNVSVSNALPGDLIFFSSGTDLSSVTHVAIYVGNGQIAHARSEELGVGVNNLYLSNGNVYSGKRIYAVVRVC